MRRWGHAGGGHGWTLLGVGDGWLHLERRGPARVWLHLSNTVLTPMCLHICGGKEFFPFYFHIAEVKSDLNIYMGKSKSMEKKHQNVQVFTFAFYNL